MDHALLLNTNNHGFSIGYSSIDLKGNCWTITQF